MQILSLPASSGAMWLRDGWRLLRQRPLALTAMVVMYSFILIVPASIPVAYVGVILLGVLSPFATLGVMAAFREVAAARVPTPALFTQALRDDAVRATLFRLGLIHAGLTMIVVVLVRLLADPGAAPTDEEPVTMETLKLAPFITFALLYSPVMIAMWFAPMLAGWHGLSVGKAIFGSAIAFLRNMGAFLLYGVLMACVMTGVALIVFAVLGALVSSPQVISLLLAPFALALSTFVQATFYPMYRSIYAEPAPA